MRAALVVQVVTRNPASLSAGLLAVLKSLENDKARGFKFPQMQVSSAPCPSIFAGS